MNTTTINTKIAKLEAIRQLVNYCEGQRNCYAVYSDDGSIIAPSIGESEWEFGYYHAWDEIINILMKEVK